MPLQLGDRSIVSNNAEWVALRVTTDMDGRDLTVPVLAVNGGSDGPCLWLQGTIHGDEQITGQVVRDVVLALEPANVRGSVIGVPVANPTAFAAKQRTSPLDHKDANRCFPGTRDGTYTDALAATLFEPAAGLADAFVGVHSAGDEATISGFTYYPTGNEEVVDASQELARAVGFTHNCGVNFGGGRMYEALALEGIPSILAERGGSGPHDDHYTALADAVRNVARHVGVIGGKPADRTDQSFYEDRYTYLAAHGGGYFDAVVGTDDRVSEGDLLAEITDVWGETREAIHAPHDGVILLVRTYPVARPGDMSIIMAA